MDTSGGRQTEKLMTVIPLAVFVFVVVVALGGPAEFVRMVGNWVGDFVDATERFLKNL